MEKNISSWVWIIIGVIVITAIIVFIPNSKVTCNSPYIKVGNSCCLDKNSNNICDEDKQEIEIKEYCGDSICQLNEKAPNCSDCNPNIRIENLKYAFENIDLRTKNMDLRINYDVIQFGDKSVVSPFLDIYKGYSQQQCSNKIFMNLSGNFSCLKECNYVIDEDIKEKTYLYKNLYAKEGMQLESPLCFYFTFELKPYSNASNYESESIVKYESNIISPKIFN